ncbi:hypothetical protein D3C85_1569490 [compost metagenome]
MQRKIVTKNDATFEIDNYRQPRSHKGATMFIADNDIYPRMVDLHHGKYGIYIDHPRLQIKLLKHRLPAVLKGVNGFLPE